jgi:hypothetical protein
MILNKHLVIIALLGFGLVACSHVSPAQQPVAAQPVQPAVVAQQPVLGTAARPYSWGATASTQGIELTVSAPRAYQPDRETLTVDSGVHVARYVLIEYTVHNTTSVALDTQSGGAWLDTVTAGSTQQVPVATATDSVTYGNPLAVLPGHRAKFQMLYGLPAGTSTLNLTTNIAPDGLNTSTFYYSGKV